MAKKDGDKRIRNGRRRDIRLRRELHFEQNREGVLSWFRELDRLNCEQFMKKGRRQPKT